MAKGGSTVSGAHKVVTEISDLERYLASCRDQAVRSLAALHAGPENAADNGVSVLQRQLQAQLDDLRAENAALGQRAQRTQESQDRAVADARRAAFEEGRAVASRSAAGAVSSAATAELAQLREQCAALERDLANAQGSLETAKAEKALSPGGAPLPSAMPPGAATVLKDLARRVSDLKAERDAIEGTVVEMYESLFSDAVVNGITSVVRQRESAALAEARRASAPAAGSGAGGKGAPRLKARLDEATARVEVLEKELLNREAEANAADRHHADLMKIHKLEAEAQLNHYMVLWKAEMEKRKTLHQKVLELKGAIRVFCRVRPLQPHDGETMSAIAVTSQEGLCITVPQTGGTGSSSGFGGGERRRASSAPLRSPSKDTLDRAAASRDLAYEFDRVFGPDDSQEVVYEDVSDLVISVADGFNVCIMAYGQTGSGKTYTMMGTRDSPGINIRALQELFEIAAERTETVEMTFQASIVEIYNDSIFDLLSDSPRETSAKLEIKESSGHIWVPNLQLSQVTTVADVAALIAKGDKGRSTFATDMNEHSSRSHLILSLYVRTDNRLSGERTASKLHLIDLAGSERLSRSNAEGQRLREAQNINQSLSLLGDVIQSLRAQSSHVPYRNCKLTRLLSDSLGGKSKTLLVVNLSPTRESAAESRCSCEFASRAKKVELGRAVRQVQPESIGAAGGGGGGGGGGGAERSPPGLGGKARAASIGASARTPSGRSASRSVSRTRAMASSPDLARFR